MNAETIQRRRVLFHSGRIVRRKDPKPCNGGYGPHEGHMLPLPSEYEGNDEWAVVWADIRTCSKCGSSVSRSQFKTRAA